MLLLFPGIRLLVNRFLVKAIINVTNNLKPLQKVIPWYAVVLVEKELHSQANFYPLTSTPSLETSLALGSPHDQARDKSFHLNIRNRVACSRGSPFAIQTIFLASLGFTMSSRPSACCVPLSISEAEVTDTASR